MCAEFLFSTAARFTGPRISVFDRNGFVGGSQPADDNGAFCSVLVQRGRSGFDRHGSALVGRGPTYVFCAMVALVGYRIVPPPRDEVGHPPAVRHVGPPPLPSAGMGHPASVGMAPKSVPHPCLRQEWGTPQEWGTLVDAVPHSCLRQEWGTPRSYRALLEDDGFVGGGGGPTDDDGALGSVLV